MLYRHVVRRSWQSASRANSLSFTPRHLSSALPRPSAVALGKRPALSSQQSLFAVGSSRSISWSPFKKASPVEDAVPFESQASTSATPAYTNSLDTSPEPPSLNEAITSSLKTSTSDPVVPPSFVQEAPLAQDAPLSPLDSNTIPDVSTIAEVIPTPSPTLEDLILHSGSSLADVLQSPEAIHAIVKRSDLSLMGLDHGLWSVSGHVRDGLVALHSITDLPWWATIAALTVCLRLLMVPLIVRNQKHNVRLQAVQPQMQALMIRLKEAKANDDQTTTQLTTQALGNLLKDNDVSPLRPLFPPLIQMPFFLGMFYGLRSLAAAPLPALKEGGLGWVTDLTIPDPYYILPITSMLLTNLVFITGADGTGSAQTSTSANGMDMRHVRNFLQMATIIAVPFVGSFPAAVLFYWTFTNAFTLLQATLLRQPIIKSILRIPTPPKIEAPPTTPSPKPSWLDTLRAIRVWFSET
ncbi:hypothetical protein TREMEDRAFT_37898, partial [Tremella mesenterica DSM 1558]|uniref:uncharacterized protein n=1 Tax=Tremella mesenterica (strain ATCC 24925 / CBS 8224 / DSM 1558 / NBRC 9311 / NRRL Y-6157 / RJB 2259-6 / UBC 559-6) TaxID=578456 RepID=UPI0003F4974D